MSQEIESRQLAVLEKRGVDMAELEVKGHAPHLLPSSFDLQSWPDNLSLYPIVHGRHVPGDFDPRRTESVRNSAVFATLNTIATAFMEPSLEPMRESTEEGGAGEFRVQRRHRIRTLLAAPNRVGPSSAYPVYMSMRFMGYGAQYETHVNGNAYWMKIRSGDTVSGNVIALWPIAPWVIEPVGPQNKNEGFPDPHDYYDPARQTSVVNYYRYDPAPGIAKPMRIDPRNIIHFRYPAVDPNNALKGMGPVRMIASEVASDALATAYTNALLRNGAVPGLVVIPEDGFVDDEKAQQIKSRMRSEFGGANQGGVAVLSAGATVKEFGYDPEKMSLTNIHKHVEERIAAVLNVPAMVAQLGAGLEQAAQFTNFHEAREMMAENTMLPLWQSGGEVLTQQLLPDFSNRADERLGYDLEKVRTLQPDITALYQRIQVGVQGGWLTANEARAKVGLPAIDEKSQQVPLTQGEDNRFNLMTEMGLVTLNEVRESIGLPPRPDGNQLLKDVAPTTFSGKGPVSGSGPEGSPLAPATPALPQVDVVSGPGGGGLPALPGGDQPSGRQGAPGTGSDQKAAYALEALFNELGPDQALMMFKRSRGKGHSLARAALEALEEAE